MRRSAILPNSDSKRSRVNLGTSLIAHLEKCGMRNAECGISRWVSCATTLHCYSAFRIPNSALVHIPHSAFRISHFHGWAMSDVPRFTRERLESLLGKMAERRIVVVGDAMLDIYLLGEAERISPEAPVPVG